MCLISLIKKIYYPTISEFTEKSKDDVSWLILRYFRSPLIFDLFDTPWRKNVKRVDDNRRIIDRKAL